MQETCETMREWDNKLKVLKEKKNCQSRVYLANLSLGNEEIKSFPDK